MGHKGPIHVTKVDELHKLSATELRRLYREVLKKAAPAKASPDLLRGNIAWHLQARARGRDSFAWRRKLRKGLERAGTAATPIYKPGTRLVREWQGEVHEVTVLGNGYRWRGVEYRSLSRIATDITGTRWSGPRFFGLKTSVR